MSELSKFPAWYIEFLEVAIRQMPRPGTIDQPTAENWAKNPNKLRRKLTDCLLQVPENSSEPPDLGPLLEAIGTVIIQATDNKLIFEKQFIQPTWGFDPKDLKEVYGFEDGYERFKGKIEKRIGQRTLRFSDLREASSDGPIIEELGGVDKSVTTFTEIVQLLKKQSRGEKGVLLTNKQANIFFVRDVKGVLQVVRVYYNSGWRLTSRNVRHFSTPGKWQKGRRVFSRDVV